MRGAYGALMPGGRLGGLEKLSVATVQPPLGSSVFSDVFKETHSSIFCMERLSRQTVQAPV